MKKTNKFPSAETIVEEAYRTSPKIDLNNLHGATFKLMMKHKQEYYKKKVKDFLNRMPVSRLLSPKAKASLTVEMLKPLSISNGKKSTLYSNFMEEASRRISQVFQAISGNVAESCIEIKLREAGLKKDLNYKRKYKRSDFTLFHPDFKSSSDIHKVEVKNVALRERGVRGLSFDGDSMMGFFNDAKEFTKETIKIIDKHCRKTGGYCYVPPEILKEILSKHNAKRFKSNEEFVADMKQFIKSGTI